MHYAPKWEQQERERERERELLPCEINVSTYFGGFDSSHLGYSGYCFCYKTSVIDFHTKLTQRHTSKTAVHGFIWFVYCVHRKMLWN
jgi:hypothetical protein